MIEIKVALFEQGQCNRTNNRRLYVLCRCSTCYLYTLITSEVASVQTTLTFLTAALFVLEQIWKCRHIEILHCYPFSFYASMNISNGITHAIQVGFLINHQNPPKTRRGKTIYMPFITLNILLIVLIKNLLNHFSEQKTT